MRSVGMGHYRNTGGVSDKTNYTDAHLVLGKHPLYREGL
jgi:hypothetical protein